MEKTKQRAKRRIKKFDFTASDSAVALVGPDVGGPANGIPTLLFKGADQFSEDFLQKASAVNLKMTLEDFLQQFSQMDTAVVAKALGYTEEDNPELQADYIASKIQNIEVIKALHQAENKLDILKELSEDDYLAFLQDQELLEKAFAESSLLVEPEGEDTSIASEVSKQEVSTSENSNLEKSNMTQEVNPEVISQEVTVEMVEKSAFDSIQKALEEQKVQLEKALETIQQFEEEKRQAIIKSKTEKIQAVVKDEKHRDIITKASLSLESEDDFTAFVAAVQAMMQTVETSDMFMEKGATLQAETPAVQESAVAKVIKARQQAKK